MEKILEKYYRDYKIIDNLLKDRLNERVNLLNVLKNKGIDEFYFSLNKTQQEMYRKIHNDNDVIKYAKNEEIIKSLEIRKKNLLEELGYSKIFPLKGEERLDIYVSDGIDTYNVINNKSTKDLDDEMKSFIKEVVKNVFGLNENYTVEDIPLIKVLIEKLRKRNVPIDDVEDILSNEVSKIHYVERSRNYQNEPIDINLLDEEIDKLVEMLNLNNRSCKDLYIEETLTAHYQYLLISGASITSLYEKLEDLKREDHLCALVKAYYNLTDIEFRHNNDCYDFKINTTLDFITSNPKVNQKILDMKIGGKNV